MRARKPVPAGTRKSLKSCKSCFRQSHPILSSNSRDLSYNARRLSCERTCPASVSSILQISKICKTCNSLVELYVISRRCERLPAADKSLKSSNWLQTVHPILSSNSRDLSYNARRLSCERTCPAESSRILQISKILQIDCSRQSTQFCSATPAISRQPGRLWYQHLSRRPGLPAMAHYNPANPAPDSPPNSLVESLVISRTTLVVSRTSAPVPPRSSPSGRAIGVALHPISRTNLVQILHLCQSTSHLQIS